MSKGIKDRLELIRRASLDVKSRIDELLEKDNRIEIATVSIEAFAEDLYKLMKDMADAANPILEKMGLDKEAVTQDISEFVKILEDNEREMYFASINLDAKYARGKYGLVNLSNWFERLNRSIDKVESFLETETEAKELKDLFALLDTLEIPEKTKQDLKEEFLRVLNKLNS